ncbi:MAG: hypothetical protein ACFN2Z_06390 [Oribacterium sp.]
MIREDTESSRFQHFSATFSCYSFPRQIRRYELSGEGIPEPGADIEEVKHGRYGRERRKKRG